MLYEVITMCNWAMQAATACRPLLNLLIDELLDGEYVNIDETTLQVLREPGRSPTTTSYMWIFRRGDPDRQVLMYQYRITSYNVCYTKLLRVIF